MTPRPAVREQLRRMPPGVWILLGGTFINRFGTFVMPMLMLYLTRQGYSIPQSGLAVGAYGAGHLLGSMAGGHLADRIGRRNTIALSMFSSAATMLALSQATGYPATVALTLLAGATAELYRPASHALIGDLVPAGERVMAFGLYRFAVNLGFAAGPAVAGILADRSFFYLFLGDAVTSAAWGCIALGFLPHGLRTYDRRERLGEALRVAARDRRFVLFLLATAAITAVDFQMGSTVALHVRAAGFSNATYGMLISLNGVLIVFFEIGLTAWLQRFPPQPVIALGYALSGTGFALTGLAHSIPALAGTVVIWTLGEMVASPMAGAYLTQLAPERYRGRYMGLWVMTWSIGMMLGPTIGTAVFAADPSILWTACGVLGAISAILALAPAKGPPDSLAP